MQIVDPTQGYCEELALLPGSQFEFTSRFLSGGQLKPLLPLYALKQAVGTIPHAPVEDSVKWAKLKWWSEEFSADPVSSSRHPVLRALWLSGARNHLNEALLQRLIKSAITQIDVAPSSDDKAMFEQLSALGATDILLELALEEAEIESQRLNYLGAATNLFHMIFSLSTDQPSGIAQLPLSLLAKYNIRSEQLEQEPFPVGFAGLAGELAEIGLEWFEKGSAGMDESLKPGVCTHLQLRLAMENRALIKIGKNTDSVFKQANRYGPADAWFAWRFLRRLK